MYHNPVIIITFNSTNVRKKRKKLEKNGTAGCMQDKNVKLPFMYQPPVPDITKFDKLRFFSKNFSLLSKKTWNTRSIEKGKTG